MKLPFVIIATIFCTVPALANAGTTNADTIYVSTIGGQSKGNGITLSSYVYIVSNSSLTLQGSAGTITTGSSITASAFFADGSKLSGISVPGGTNTFSGANNFTSSFTIQSAGNQIILSTSSSINNVNISSTGAASFFPLLHNSTSTTISQYSTSISTFGPCVAGSTLTLTATGGQIEVTFTGDFYSTGGVSDCPGPAISFLQDGQFVRDLSTTKSVLANYEYNPAVPSCAGSFAAITNFNYLLPAPSPGVHSYCLTIKVSVAGSVTLANDSSHANLFYVKELK